MTALVWAIRLLVTLWWLPAIVLAVSRRTWLAWRVARLRRRVARVRLTWRRNHSA